MKSKAKYIERQPGHANVVTKNWFPSQCSKRVYTAAIPAAPQSVAALGISEKMTNCAMCRCDCFCKDAYQNFDDSMLLS